MGNTVPQRANPTQTADLLTGELRRGAARGSARALGTGAAARVCVQPVHLFIV